MTIRQMLLFSQVRLPVRPRDTEELVPPASDDHRNVEAENERERDETRERLAIQGDSLKHPTTQLYNVYNKNYNYYNTV